MATMTIRVPDTKHARLKKLAAQKGVSINKMFEEWSNVAIAQADTEARFIARAARGNARRGLELLEKLDSHFSRKGE